MGLILERGGSFFFLTRTVAYGKRLLSPHHASSWEEEEGDALSKEPVSRRKGS